MPTREESKAQRRRAIVAAARTLMQQTGQAGFSMRGLSDQAGVSIATPYNLFGSKQAVMYAVLDADLEQYQTRLERLKSDELDVFFQAVSLASKLYSAEPGFYRAVLFAVYSDGGTEFRAMFSGPRHVMWRRMVTNAQAAGLIDEAIEPNSFAITISQLLFAIIMEWVNGLLSLEELEARGHYGFAVALSGVATPAAAPRVREQLMAAQQRLKDLHKQRRAHCTPAEESVLGPVPEPKAANGGR